VGYRYIPSPAPAQDGARNDLDNLRHLMAAGLGVEWSSLRLDLGVQWHHLVSRTHHKTGETIEAAGFPADEHPGFPQIRHGGEIWVAGLELGIAL
jgi:hypothetical protein